MESPPVNEMVDSAKRETIPLRLVVVAKPEGRPERRPVDLLRLAIGGMLAPTAAALALWIAAKSKGVGSGVRGGGVQATLQLGQGVLHAMRNGPWCYWLLWIVMVGSLVLMILVRRAEDPDGSGVSQRRPWQAADGGRRRRDERPILRAFGNTARVTRFCRRRESNVTTRWSVPLIALSVTVLLLTFPWRQSPVHWVLWAYTAFAVTMSIRAVANGSWQRMVSKFRSRVGEGQRG